MEILIVVVLFVVVFWSVLGGKDTSHSTKSRHTQEVYTQGLVRIYVGAPLFKGLDYETNHSRFEKLAQKTSEEALKTVLDVQNMRRLVWKRHFITSNSSEFITEIDAKDASGTMVKVPVTCRCQASHGDYGTEFEYTLRIGDPYSNRQLYDWDSESLYKTEIPRKIVELYEQIVA